MTYSPEALLRALQALNAVGAPYILTGSIATNLYAPPRATVDADFVVVMSAEQLDQLFALLKADFVREPQMSFETVTGKTQHKFRYSQSAFVIEIFEADLGDAHERARFERRILLNVEGSSAHVTTAEDVIVQKLRWYRKIRRLKDRMDIDNVMQMQWDALDWPYIEHWCREHGTLDLLDECRKAAEKALREG